MKRLATGIVTAIVVVMTCMVITVVTLIRMFVPDLSALGLTSFSFNCVLANASISGLDETQASHAVTIVGVGLERELPERAFVIAIATAMQESELRNLANSSVKESLDIDHDGIGHDHNSVGLFQQRPPDWGSVSELMDPVYASDAFYAALEKVDAWESLPLTRAAQLVQLSAHPDAYAKHEERATSIVQAVLDEANCDIPEPGLISELGWTHPLPGTPLVSDFRTSHRPTHNGADFAAPHGTPIYAAGDGEVLTVACNAYAPNGSAYSCDVDGSPSIRGCGWYVDLGHADGSATRYCHMVERPLVNVGDDVGAGHVLGYVGSSGNSSGPHLHFEAHNGWGRDSSTATNPTEFMRLRGVAM